MKRIKQKKIKPQTVIIPGSKSISHRMLICASLAQGRSIVSNLLESEDILLTMNALRKMGADIVKNERSQYLVQGFDGRPHQYDAPIDLGNSGTSMRLIAGIAALGDSEFMLTGDDRMCQRPMKELLDALHMLHISAVSKSDSGTPPVIIKGQNREGGAVFLDCSKSSQYLSSLLLMGALFKHGIDIQLKGRPVSSPYVDLTIDIMNKFGVIVHKISETMFKVPGNQVYHARDCFVEPDLSNAGYFWAAGAITGTCISVDNITPDSIQGDVKLIEFFREMGCDIVINDHSIGVRGSSLKGITVDMADTPDAVPALAIVAAFAKGKTRIQNIRHLREKECDRIDAISSQLVKMGIGVQQGDDFMIIEGGFPKSATIETFNDHRIAMAFSVAGLLINGIEIENPSCVSKSFPNYWEIFDAL